MTTNREVFDQIAESWYQVRHWPLLKEELEELAARWQSGKLLNVGCAHGPDFLPFSQGFELWGVDSSPAMLKQALRYSAKFKLYVNLMAADALSLPFPNNTFDWAISVATYHHIKGREERGKAFVELKRVLKPQGEAFLTMWNHGHYHLFSYGELRKLLVKTGWEIITMSPEKSYHFPIRNFSRNICVLVKKQSTPRVPAV